MNELKNQVTEINNVIMTAFQHFNTANQIRNDMRRRAGGFSAWFSRLWIVWKILLVLVGIQAIGFMAILSVFSAAEKYYQVPIVIIAIAALIVYFGINQHKKNETIKGELTASADTEDEEGYRIISQNADLLRLLPSEYLYPLATEYIAKMINSDRADSIKEALSMYDEQQHRWTMEQNMSNMMNLQISQLNALRNIEILQWLSM